MALVDDVAILIEYVLGVGLPAEGNVLNLRAPEEVADVAGVVSSHERQIACDLAETVRNRSLRLAILDAESVDVEIAVDGKAHRVTAFVSEQGHAIQYFER